MREEAVSFFSEGCRLTGFMRWPDTPPAENPAVLIHGPGWLGLCTAKNYETWHRAFTNAGYAVLAFDYRGFGTSEGDRGWIRPDWQVEDICNAATYLTTRPDIDPARIGVYGMGGTGGGNAIVAAALDSRLRCVAVQSVVADGREWLRAMRREYEWVEYLRRLEADAQEWATSGTGAMVHPRTDLMVETPERRSAGLKKDVDALMPEKFFLRSAEYIMRCRPIDHVVKLSPRALLMTAVEDDVVTPESHARQLFRAAGQPKRLIRQTNATHYDSYKVNYDYLSAEIVRWYDQYLVASPVSDWQAPDFSGVQEGARSL